MNNIKTYNEVSSLLDIPIKELKNIPVHIVDEDKFEEIYEYGNLERYKNFEKMYKHNSCNKACFITGGDTESSEYFTTPFIIILEGLSIEKQIFSFFHEYGHYICYNNKCPCMNIQYSSELHAWRNSFELMLHYKCYKSLIIALKLLDKYKKHNGNEYSDESMRKNIHEGITSSMRPLFRKVKKWVEQCPKKYKNGLIKVN